MPPHRIARIAQGAPRVASNLYGGSTPQWIDGTPQQEGVIDFARTISIVPQESENQK